MMKLIFYKHPDLWHVTHGEPAKTGKLVWGVNLSCGIQTGFSVNFIFDNPGIFSQYHKETHLKHFDLSINTLCKKCYKKNKNELDRILIYHKLGIKQ